MINPQYNIYNQYNQNQYQNQKPQLNIIFKTTQGIRQNFRFYYGTTINQVLITYLNKIGRPDLINKQSDEIYFTYNSTKLNFNDQRKIENAFNNADPSIEVHYTEKMYKTININNSRNDRNNFFANIRRTKTISDLSNNIPNTIYNESENDKLKRQLNEEKSKNLKLTNENKILKKKISALNDKIKKLEEMQINQDKLKFNKSIKQNDFLVHKMKPSEQLLNVTFITSGTNGLINYQLICKNTELFVRLEERFYNDFPQFKEYDLFFKNNNKKIKRFKTLEENNIKNKDVINIFINNN